MTYCSRTTTWAASGLPAFGIALLVVSNRRWLAAVALWIAVLAPASAPAAATTALTTATTSSAPLSANVAKAEKAECTTNRKKRHAKPKFIRSASDESTAERDRRLSRECKGRSNSGACLGYTR